MVPYTKIVEADVTGGVAGCVVLPAPIRGIVNRLIVGQSSGNADGFSVNLFDRADACEAAAEESVSVDESSFGIVEIHKVMPTQVVAAPGTTLELHEKVWSYLNQDERDPGSMRPTGALYLEIDAAGSGPKHFYIAYTITIPEMT